MVLAVLGVMVAVACTWAVCRSDTEERMTPARIGVWIGVALLALGLSLLGASLQAG
jgi:hypothetical protein